MLVRENLRQRALEQIRQMPRMVRGDVLELPNTGFQALVAVFLHIGIHSEALILQNMEDVGSENNCPASEISQPQNGLYWVL